MAGDHVGSDGIVNPRGRWPSGRRRSITIAASLVVVVVTLFAAQLLGLGQPVIGQACDLGSGRSGAPADPWAIASRASPDHPTYAALDGDFKTWWGAEAHPVQWIEIGLDEVTSVAELRLTVSQTPDGPTEHRVYGRMALGSELRLLHTFSGDTSDGDVLTVAPMTPLPPVCFLRVVTDVSPSWVSWREIEIVASRP
jgi:hypothetical protein